MISWRNIFASFSPLAPLLNPTKTRHERKRYAAFMAQNVVNCFKSMRKGTKHFPESEGLAEYELHSRRFELEMKLRYNMQSY